MPEPSHPTDGAEFDKPSPKVESKSYRTDPNRWANLPKYPQADPWQATSYLISGVLLWGLIGYGAARWLNIPFLTGVGIVIGGVLGIWLTYIRYGRPQSGSSTEVAPAPSGPASVEPATPHSPQSRVPSPAPGIRRTSGLSSSELTAEEEKP